MAAPTLSIGTGVASMFGTFVNHLQQGRGQALLQALGKLLVSMENGHAAITVEWVHPPSDGA